MALWIYLRISGPNLRRQRNGIHTIPSPLSRVCESMYHTKSKMEVAMTIMLALVDHVTCGVLGFAASARPA